MISQLNTRSIGWIDSLAVTMSMVCAIHCLLTPIVVVFLPIVATTAWVHEDFHLWMILFVIPTTSAAVFMGCRKHKDKAVLVLSMIGLSLLISVALYETVFHSELALQEHVHGATCTGINHGNGLAANTLVNVLGGFLLASAHVRNYFLCRKSNCNHDH